MSAQVNGELVPVGGGDPIPLIRESLTIGRREPCDICLRFPNVSSRHCLLSFHDGYWEIRDLNSTNGVKVNGSRVQKSILRPGDRITIAKRHYTLEYEMLADPKDIEELEEETSMGPSLLEKAGLSKGRGSRSAPRVDPHTMQAPDDDD